MRNFLHQQALPSPTGEGLLVFLLLKTTGSFHVLKPDRGRAPWACHHIYYKHIVISHFSTIYLHNFFPEPHIDSDLCIHHFFKSVPRIKISTQILIWRAHGRHSTPWIMKNPEFQKFMKRPFQLQDYDR